MEKIQRDVSHNHRLVPGPELEEKALVLKQLGETLTELKGEPGGQQVWHVVQVGVPAAPLPPPPVRPSLLPIPSVPGASSCPAHFLWSPQLTSQAYRARCG